LRHFSGRSATCPRSASHLLLAGVLAAVWLVVPSPASAQIYSWRDANGSLVLSNLKPANPTEVRSYAVPEATTVRSTRYAASNRSRPYDDLIEEHARLNGVRTELVRAVIQVESGFNPAAHSPKGAMGLMQLMPATARELGVANPYNAAENIRGGVAYLRQLLDRYQDNEELALAAYNAGPAAVDKHGENVPPYRETRDYVSRINRMAGTSGTASGPIGMQSGQIYKVTEIVDGREVVRYTDRKPSTGAYAVVGSR
jgi:soluble lytic murein transglycosylase-like protein